MSSRRSGAFAVFTEENKDCFQRRFPITETPFRYMGEVRKTIVVGSPRGTKPIKRSSLRLKAVSKYLLTDGADIKLYNSA